jgi:cytochrome c-type biogenesis protein CcsB
VNPTTLASYSNLALYSSMVVFAFAMLAFTGHLASLKPVRRDEVVTVSRRKTLVGTSGEPVDSEADATSVVPRPQDLAATGAAYGPSQRAMKMASVGLTLTWLATLLLVSSVVLRGLSVSRPPWGNMFEFATAAACAAAVAFSVLARRNRWEWLGVFVVGPILLALGLSVTAFYVEAAELMPILKSVWLAIHVTVAVLAVGAFSIGAALGAVYLLKARRDARAADKASFLDALPGSATLERATYAVNVAGFILWTFTLVAGAIWAQKAWGSYWTWDPKEVWTFVVWCIYAAYMHARATAGWEPRKATIIALAGYAAVIINFAVVNIFFVGQHSYAGK